MRRLTIVLLAATVALALAAGTASGAAPNPTADCNANSRLTQHYTPTQLREALATMPADTKEYTNCYDVIQRALVGELGQSPTSGGRQSGSSSGDSLLPTPVIVVLALLVVAGAAFGIVALRRRGAVGGGDHP
jgi:ABC-type dipeptide/oligopeptide/nickel transport system permease component